MSFIGSVLSSMFKVLVWIQSVATDVLWSSSDALRGLMFECWIRVTAVVEWTWKHTFDVVFRGLYFHGPEIPGLGLFWKGMRKVDICTALTKGVNSDFWRDHDGGPNAQCMNELERHYVSFLYGVGLCAAIVFGLLAYKEYESMRLRAHVTRDMTQAMASFANVIAQRKKNDADSDECAQHAQFLTQRGGDGQQPPRMLLQNTQNLEIGVSSSLHTHDGSANNGSGSGSAGMDRHRRRRHSSRSRFSSASAAAIIGNRNANANSMAGVIEGDVSPASNTSPGTRRRREVVQLLAATFSEVLSDSLNMTQGVLTRGMRQAHALVQSAAHSNTTPNPLPAHVPTTLLPSQPQEQTQPQPANNMDLLALPGPASPSPFR